MIPAPAPRSAPTPRPLFPPVTMAAAAIVLCSGLGQPLAAADKRSAEPPTQVVPVQSDPAEPGARFVLNADPTQPTLAFFALGKSKARLEFRDEILHLTVLSGLLRLDLASGAELVILSPGDDIEIAGLLPADFATPASRTLLTLHEKNGDAADAANHRLQLARAVPLRLRNNGGYPIAITAKERLLRLDEGGSGLALHADGSLAAPPAAPLVHKTSTPRTPANPARGGASPTALLKP